ncbi:MAG: RnfABCDGE type electron transport complex subunit G [Methylococcales bacterium]
MNGFIKCSVALALISLGMLLLVSSIEIYSANKIQRNQRNHKHTLVNHILKNLDYDALLSLQLVSAMPINLTSSVSLSSMDTIIINEERFAVLIELATNSGYNGIIKLLVAIRADGVLLGSRVIEHHETPGLGDKIESHRSNWINTFFDKSLSTVPNKDWKVKRDGGKFDQFTGATITPRAVVTAVHLTLLFVQEHNEALFQEKISHSVVIP